MPFRGYEVGVIKLEEGRDQANLAYSLYMKMLKIKGKEMERNWLKREENEWKKQWEGMVLQEIKSQTKNSDKHLNL